MSDSAQMTEGSTPSKPGDCTQKECDDGKECLRRHRMKFGRPGVKPVCRIKYDRLPPGFRMRLCRIGREITQQEIDKHNDLTSNRPGGGHRELDLNSNGKPVQDNTRFPGTYYLTRLVKKLECSGIILLYGEDRFILDDFEPIIANHYKDPSDTLYNRLRALAMNPPVGAKYYKVSRYRVELKFAQDYFENFWDPVSVKRHLGYYANQFLFRETINKRNNRPIRI